MAGEEPTAKALGKLVADLELLRARMETLNLEGLRGPIARLSEVRDLVKALNKEK